MRLLTVLITGGGPPTAAPGQGPRSGATGVPFFVLDRRYGVSGGRPAEVFTQALEQAWRGRAISPVGADAAACEADGSCEVPQR